MPYYITDKNSGCPAWAVEKEDGEVLACHDSKQSAIDQAIAVSLAEETEFLGERAAVGELKLGDFVSWDITNPKIMAEVIMVQGELAVVEVYELEDTVYHSTERLMVVNVLKLKRVTRPELVSEKVEDVEEQDEGNLPDNYRPSLNPDVPEGRACGNCFFFDETRLNDEGDEAWCQKWSAFVEGDNYCDAWQQDEERQAKVARIEKGTNNPTSQESEKMAKIENRTNQVMFEVRQLEGGEGMTFTGYAAVFNSPSEPLPFIERIAPGAFKRSLKARNDIKLLWNHDTGSVLGSTRAGTLKLEEDTYGLRVTAILPPTSLGNDVKTLIQRGDVNAMSFGFSVPANGDSWNTEGTERTLRSVRIHEVSIVAFPAYSQTAGTAMVRSLDKIATRAEVDADVLADAMLAVEDGKDLTLEQAEALTKVVQRLSPQEETQEADSDELTRLELKKKKLDLLLKRF